MDSVMKLCPRCRMVFYLGTFTWDAECPHCGFRIGMWLERRSGLRIKNHHPVVIQGLDTRCSCYTLDHSDRGMRVTYQDVCFAPHEAVMVRAVPLGFDGPAVVVWTRTIDDSEVQSGIVLI